MAQAIRIETHGGPEVLQLVEKEVGDPGPGEALVRQTAIGLNFIDTYQRTGLYPVDLPSGIGLEAAGVVEAVGDGVDQVSAGQRVAYAGGPPGAYASARTLPADVLVPLPDDISDEQAAAAMLKGMTACYLLRRTYPVGEDDAVLVHAAAGGVGLLLCQWARHLGATVIGTVGSDDKAELARANGCHHTVVYTREDFTDRTRELTGGRGVDVVYDGVGKATWDGSLDSLRPRGMMVSFGNASGAVPPFSPLVLSQKGSLFLTRPTLMSYTATRDELQALAGELFEVLTTGAVEVAIHHRRSLAEAAEAHRDLEARRTTGATILEP